MSNSPGKDGHDPLTETAGGAIPADSLHPTRGGPVKPKDARRKAWRSRILQVLGALAGALLHPRARTAMTPKDLGRAVPAGPPLPNHDAAWRAAHASALKAYRGWKAQNWPEVECVAAAAAAAILTYRDVLERTGDGQI